MISESNSKVEGVLLETQELLNNGGLRSGDVDDDVEYPSGEFEFKLPDETSNIAKLRMLITYPWQRVRKGSVLKMNLRGQV